MDRSSTIQCPLCNDAVDKLVYRFHLGNERQVIELIKKSNPQWTENDGACSRCIDYYHTEIVMLHRVLPEIGPYFPVKSADDFIILPIGLRLDTDPRFTGKGVTICFIDSGFYPHPDLVSPNNRIKKMTNITGAADHSSENAAWHGTMTTVVGAGNGYLSNGLYKAIASEAELVLLAVQDDKGQIKDANIVKALQWVETNHEQYDIRIINMSLGSNEAISYKESEIGQLTERLTEKGITIIAAIGNDESSAIKPPANSPYVISIGGMDDENKLEKSKKLYHSSYGKTIDELMKPELAAPAIWIAAPILPGTSQQKEAAALHKQLEDDTTGNRADIIQQIQTSKYISPHYMHVDGTSFAAPVVSAVVAQLLEANPHLSPAAIREILFSTAKRIDGLPAERQGFGVIQPGRAVLQALKKETVAHTSPAINRQLNIIEFYTRSNCASQVFLAGDFNNWTRNALLMEAERDGVWKIGIPMLPAGRYSYKFCIDNQHWIEDVNNPYREPDGFTGFNSILFIEN